MQLVSVLENENIINAKKIVLAFQDVCSAWLTKVLKQHNIELYNNQVDIGVLVETSNIVMEETIIIYMKENLFIIQL